MKINIASVLKNDGASKNFSEQLELGTVEFMGSTLCFNEPAVVEGVIKNIGGTVEIDANVKANYQTQCSRCGEMVEQTLETYMSESVSDDFSDVDEECLSLCGTVLDIQGLVEASIYGNIPFRFLCNEECKGLCPQCGINLNNFKCNCDTTVYDPRFAIFRKLGQRGVENGSSKEKDF